MLYPERVHCYGLGMTDDERCTDTVVFCGWSYIGFCVHFSQHPPKAVAFKSLEKTHSGDTDQTHDPQYVKGHICKLISVNMLYICIADIIVVK